MQQEEFEETIKLYGAEILPFISFLSSSGQFAVLVSDVSFLYEVQLDAAQKSYGLEQNIFFGLMKQSKKVENRQKKVRKKGNEYYYFGSNDGVLIMTRV